MPRFFSFLFFLLGDIELPINTRIQQQILYSFVSPLMCYSIPIGLLCWHPFLSPLITYPMFNCISVPSRPALLYSICWPWIVSFFLHSFVTMLAIPLSPLSSQHYPVFILRSQSVPSLLASRHCPACHVFLASSLQQSNPFHAISRLLPLFVSSFFSYHHYSTSFVPKFHNNVGIVRIQGDIFHPTSGCCGFCFVLLFVCC